MTTGSWPRATEDRVLALLPSAKDGERTVGFLASVGVTCSAFKEMAALCDVFARDGAGALLVTDEALVADKTRCLATVLAKQPPWSAVPVLVLAREGGPARAESLLPDAASGFTIIELPMRTRTLVSVVRAALRARRYQYQSRDAIEERERKAAEVLTVTAASERQGRLYQTILGSTPDPVCVLDRDRRVAFANAALLDVWGKHAEASFGRRISELGYEPHQAELLEREIELVFATKEHLRGEAPFTGVQGRRVYDYLIVPVLGAAGEVEAVTWICRNITTRKEFEVAIGKQAEMLRDADRRKDAFLATLAHELRNPLAPVRTGLELLRRAPQGAAAARTREMMDRQLRHMVRLIDDLLDVSRITRGKIELKREPVTLASVIDAAVEANRPLVEAGRHDLRVSLPDEAVWFNADATRLCQAVSNLINNAAKYSPSGGVIEVRALHANGDAIIEVRDNGVGIPKDKLTEVFEMFSQVNRTLDRSQGGLGIGLALVRSLVEMHGGAVAAYSGGLDQGSTFTIRVPIEPYTERSATRPAVHSASHGAHRILVVDDNTDAAESFAMLLEMWGHPTRTAFDGQDALAVARDFQPEVVFLDIGLPGMNGYEVAGHLRRQMAPRSALLVAVTGWGTAEDKQRAAAAGFDHHLTKPVDLQSVEALLATKRASEQLAPSLEDRPVTSGGG